MTDPDPPGTGCPEEAPEGGPDNGAPEGFGVSDACGRGRLGNSGKFAGAGAPDENGEDGGAPELAASGACEDGPDAEAEPGA